MKSIDPNNTLALEEISKRQKEMKERFEQAQTLEASHQYFDALKLYEEAQHSSYHAGEGLKVTIINEPVDQSNWHKINKRIEAVKRKINLDRHAL